MGRCVLLNFKLPQSISDLELRALLTHPRLMFYLGLAQCHVWAVTGHSSCAGLGGSCLQLCLGWQIPAGVLWWGKVSGQTQGYGFARSRAAHRLHTNIVVLDVPQIIERFGLEGKSKDSDLALDQDAHHVLKADSHSFF